jgi:enoyl-CoA hydratase/carnithine racemase
MAEEVLCSIDGGVATLTLNRPEKRNALNGESLSRLGALFSEFEEDRAARVVVIRGAGEIFCAGRDLNEVERERRDGDRPDSDIVALFRRIERASFPTIAMVNGDALAGGCELAVHCDLRIAQEGARLGMPLARLGLMVPYDLTVKLVEVIGPAFTRHFLLTGKPVEARRAYEMGMVHQVVPPRELEETTRTLANTIASNAPLALQGIKASILRAVSLREQIPHEDMDAFLMRTVESADAREGLQAWMERRTPIFRGE